MIDWHRVRELRQEVGAEDFAEVAALFLEESDEVAERLANAPVESQLEADFHFLKGSALNLGFESLAAICASEERRAAVGEFIDINVGAALDCYAQSKSQFLLQLDSDEAA